MKPVAWYRDEDGIRMYYDKQYFDDAKPLYSAQREQEPVAWIAEGSENLYWDKVEALADSDGWITPLYKRRELVGLTDEEVKKEVEIEMEYYWDGDYIKTTGARDQLKNFARTIEAKLKEKND